MLYLKEWLKASGMHPIFAIHEAARTLGVKAEINGMDVTFTANENSVPEVQGMEPLTVGIGSWNNPEKPVDTAKVDGKMDVPADHAAKVDTNDKVENTVAEGFTGKTTSEKEVDPNATPNETSADLNPNRTEVQPGQVTNGGTNGTGKTASKA